MYSQLKAILVFLFCLLISSTWNKSLTFHKLFFLLGQSLEAVRLEQLHQFYTLIFTKHPHQFIYSTHLFNKIFILLPFFIILSLAAFLSQTQSESTETQAHLPQNNSFSLTDPNHHHTNLKILPQNNFLSLTEPNHHHTNLKILASTKHSFITTFIASSLQWVSKVDSPLLRLRRLIGEALVHRIVMSLQWVRPESQNPDSDKEN